MEFIKDTFNALLISVFLILIVVGGFVLIIKAFVILFHLFSRQRQRKSLH